MDENKGMVLIPLGGNEIPDFKGLIRSTRKNSMLEVSVSLSDETSTGLIQQYENCVSLTNSINDVEISYSTNALYNYFNRNPEIEVLMESIKEIGQQQPIIVIQKDDKYIVIDGVLRFLAMIRLDLKMINVLISDFDPTNEFSLSDLFIHNQIQKVKKEDEKLNEIKTILRICSEDYNSTND
jgi:hypothetical protein